MTVTADFEPAAYWATYERQIDSLANLIEAATMVAAYQESTGTRFVWRGAAGADWGLKSSLALRYQRRTGTVAKEDELAAYEHEVLDEARRWALDWHPEGGRLAGLELLARLQHHGAPTRLIDFTFNPLIALWFAVEKHDHLASMFHEFPGEGCRAGVAASWG